MLELALTLTAAQSIAAEPPEKPAVTAPGTTEWFPLAMPPLAPYLDNLNNVGDTCLQPGALIEHDPLSDDAQRVKTLLAHGTFEYQLFQAYNLTVMSDTVQGNSTLNAYSFDLYANWNVFRARDIGGWVSAELGGGSGLGVNWDSQTPQDNLGVQTNPAGVWLPPSFWVGELAWATSLCDGKLVVVAGLVDQSNYIDTNKYSQNQYGQMLNSAFINSAVIPLPYNNLGLNIQWQPDDSFYAIFGMGSNNQLAGDSPTDSLSSENVSYLAELGFETNNLMGLGRGVYRLQPFVATVGSQTGAGLGVNIEQSLGKGSPVGAYGRFGLAQDRIASVGGANAQAAVGIAVLAPFAKSGPFSDANTNYLGLGAKWTREPITNHSEYAIEATYNMQLTSTISLQPDVQVIFDPVDNPAASTVLVFQFQVNMTW